VIRTDGHPAALVADEGRWSDWLHVKFRMGVLQHVRGMVRFLLVRTEPALELYASPVNFDPAAPPFPISHPPEYAADLERALGTFYTTGMVEDHGGLTNGRVDEEHFLAQCAEVLAERERMLQYELDRLDRGLLFCLFDTPDRLQHMFWRFREPEHPANGGRPVDRWAHVIEDHYRACDVIVGEVLARADDRTLVIVLSDHGFTSFQRGVHLNTWLHDHGFLTLAAGASPADEPSDFLRHVDWSRTKAYALGLGSIYLNRRGREAQGIVSAADAGRGGAGDRRRAHGAPRRGARADRDPGCQRPRRDLRGPVHRRGARPGGPLRTGVPGELGTALGAVPGGHFEDNDRRWGGDHIVDPARVPGVLFMKPPVRRRRRPAARPGPDDPRRARRPQGPGDGRAARCSRRVAARRPSRPRSREALRDRSRLRRAGAAVRRRAPRPRPPPDGRRVLRAPRERRPADHDPGVALHGDQPGPGSLGVYGFPQPRRPLVREARDGHLALVPAPTIWDYLAMEGRRSVLIGVPPSFPPPRVNGIASGCFMTPSVDEPYTHPPEVAARSPRSSASTWST
jgi:hypothetical protein